MLLFVSICKLVAEIALLALAGQWVLGLLAGAKREQNLFYQILQMATRPFVYVTRAITPKVVIDRHVPLVAFLLLVFAWIIATWSKINICVQIGLEHCR
jgi:hypothetical protein